MTETEFQTLCIHDKGIILFTEGNLVSYREYYDQKIDRYALYGFQVEVYYNYGRSKIKKIEVLASNNVAD